MKKLVIQAVITAVAICASAQTTSPLNHEWKATVTVVDEAGQLVPGATVVVSYYVQPPPGRPEAGKQIEGVTDTNGVFTASHSDTTIDLGLRATKPGYYPTSKGYELGLPLDYNPVKWSPTVTLLLKKIGKPIPMYAKRVESKIQKEDTPVGFDLTTGDWVAPFGSGKNADLFFTVHRKIVSERDYYADVRLTFPNKGDGIAVAPTEPDTGSDLRTARIATEHGYEPERMWHYSNSANSQPVFGYFFRVRTVLDENGNLKSALYGKIRGDIRFYAGTRAPRAGMGFDYYLNPTPKDRSVEFDPSRNLLKGLNAIEGANPP